MLDNAELRGVARCCTMSYERAEVFYTRSSGGTNSSLPSFKLAEGDL